MNYKYSALFGMAAILSCATFTAQAASQVVYLGAAPVYSETNFNWSLESASAPSVQTGTLIDNYSGNLQAALFGGYGIIFGSSNNLYLGFEGGTTLGNITADNTVTLDPVTSTSVKATMNSMFNLDLRPGYIFGSNNRNSMLYLIAGATTADFSFKGTDSSGNTDFSTNDERRYGARLGAGYGLGLGSHVMARVEYVFSDYGDFDLNDNGYTYKVNPISHEVDFGISVLLPV